MVDLDSNELIQGEPVKLFVGGVWCDGANRRLLPVVNPHTGTARSNVACADRADIDRAISHAATAFRSWSKKPALQRSETLLAAARLIGQRAHDIARDITIEQGKPLEQAIQEVESAAAFISWFAEEAKRTYGTVIPSRQSDVRQSTMLHPVGPVAAFTPWNYPFSQAARKVGAALASGCSVILKGPEYAPAAPVHLVQAFIDAGLPADALALVYGDAPAIANQLIESENIRKISFTGSTQVGKQLMRDAGAKMKRTTMELGGHAPVIVFNDTDIKRVAMQLATMKLRNAGQNCLAPTRILVEGPGYRTFLREFVSAMERGQIGYGMDPSSHYGPLMHFGRVKALDRLVTDAVDRGAVRQTGGAHLNRKGWFYPATVLSAVPNDALVMNEEPFGPIAVVNSFGNIDQAIEEANRLSYGLAAYIYTSSLAKASHTSREIESGMVSVNHYGLGLPEVPFGGIKDSGHGTEGGSGALAEYMYTKFITEKAVDW